MICYAVRGKHISVDGDLVALGLVGPRSTDGASALHQELAQITALVNICEFVSGKYLG